MDLAAVLVDALVVFFVLFFALVVFPAVRDALFASFFPAGLALVLRLR